MVFKSIKHGFSQAFSFKKIVLIYYLVNFLFAIFIALFFRNALSDYLAGSLAGARIFEAPDMNIVFEFLKYKGDSIQMVFLLFILFSMINRLFLLFLSGGTLSIIASNGHFSAEKFWGNSAKFFSRFVRLALLSIPFLVLLLLLPQIYDVIERLAFGKNPYQNITFWGGWIKTGLRYLSLLLFALLFDYTRIFTVFFDEIKIRMSITAGLQFILRHFLVTFSIAFVLAVIGIFGFGFYTLIVHLIPTSNILLFVILFSFQQVYFLFRAFLKLTGFSSQIYFFKIQTFEAEPVKIADDSSLSNFEA